LMLRVRVGQLVFEGYTTDGLLIAPDGFSGWDSGTDSKGQTISRDDAHGDYDMPVFRQSRIVSISGQALADSDRRLVHMGAQVTGLGSSGELLRITVEHHGLITWADGRVVSQTQWDERGGHGVADYQIQFRFADPRKFGETASFGSGAPAFHYGNFPATPQITVSGSMPSGYTVNGPDGKRFVVTRALVGGSPHAIDMETGLLRVNGALVYGGVSVANTWAIPAGRSVTHSLNGSGSGVLAVKVADTYV
jgi:hypothetical protein